MSQYRVTDEREQSIEHRFLGEDGRPAQGSGPFVVLRTEVTLYFDSVSFEHVVKPVAS